MRRLVVAAMILVLVNGSMAAQELALETRAPRFLFAGSLRGAPVEIDARSNATLRQVVSLNIDQPTVGRLLAAIERQTGLRFAYSRDVLRTDRLVAFRADTITLGGALLAILLDTGVDVVLSRGRQVSLVERPKVVADTGVIGGQVTDRKTGAVLVGATVGIEGTRYSAMTGSDGRYRIAGVMSGTYTLRARYIGYTPGSTSVTVAGDQEAAADFALERSAQQLDEVVTTGTLVPTEVKALPTPVSIISESDVAAQRPHAIQELFRQAVPGAVSWDLASAPYYTALSVRGSSTLAGNTAQMKVFVDGVEAPVASVAGVDPNSIQRIEVVRGPQAAAIYGSEAIGGVVQILTKRGDPGLRRPTVHAEAAMGLLETPYAGVGSVLRQNYSASVRGGGSDVGYHLGAGYSRTGDWLPGGELSRQSNPSIYGGMHFERGIVAIDVSGRYYTHNYGGVGNPELAGTGLAFVSKPFYSPQQIRNQSVGARLDLTPVPWWQHTVAVGVHHYNLGYAQTRPRLTTPDDTLLQVLNQTQTKSSISYSTTVRAAAGPHVSAALTAGFDHWSVPVSMWFALSALNTTGSIRTAPGQPPSASRNVTNNTGYFGQAQVGLYDALFLTLGVRAENNTNFGDSLGTPLSPRVGVSLVRPAGAATVKLRGSWGRALRAPSPGLKLGGASATSVTLPNPELGPERQQGWDAGFDLAFGSRGSIGVTYYDQTADRLIDFVLVASDPTLTYQNQNVGRVKNRGVEIEGALRLGDLLQLKAQYGYTRSRLLQLAPGYTGDLQVGDQTLLSPKHTAGVLLSLAPTTRTSVTGGLTYTGSWRQYDYLAEFGCFGGTRDCPSSFPASTRGFIASYPDFVKLNATVTQQVTAAAAAFLSVDNLTNSKAYEADNLTPVMGRVTTVGVQLRY